MPSESLYIQKYFFKESSGSGRAGQYPKFGQNDMSKCHEFRALKRKTKVINGGKWNIYFICQMLIKKHVCIFRGYREERERDTCLPPCACHVMRVFLAYIFCFKCYFFSFGRRISMSEYVNGSEISNSYILLCFQSIMNMPGNYA